MFKLLNHLIGWNIEHDLSPKETIPNCFSALVNCKVHVLSFRSEMNPRLCTNLNHSLHFFLHLSTAEQHLGQSPIRRHENVFQLWSWEGAASFRSGFTVYEWQIRLEHYWSRNKGNSSNWEEKPVLDNWAKSCYFSQFHQSSYSLVSVAYYILEVCLHTQPIKYL